MLRCKGKVDEFLDAVEGKQNCKESLTRYAALAEAPNSNNHEQMR